MSKQCPSCHKDIEISDTNLGSLYTCSQCSAVYFINFDGDPEYEELNVSDQVYEQQSSLDSVKPEEINLGGTSDSESALAVEHSFQTFEPSLAESSNEQSFGDNPSIDEDQLTVEPVEDSRGIEDLSVVSKSSPVSASNAIEEINEFANSTDVNLTGLSYRVLIQGIDSKALLQEVKEALEDARFNWDVGILLSKRKDGVIQLDQLTPVKAALVIQRLRLSGLDFKWEEVSG